MNKRRFVVSPIVLLVAILTAVGFGAPSAAATGGLETRVRAIDTPTATVVRAENSESPASVGHLRHVSAAFASATGVATEDGERTYDWRKLGYREFENFFGESAEDVKKDIVGSGGSKFDLYEDKCTGEIFVLGKGGVGEPQPTGYRFPK